VDQLSILLHPQQTSGSKIFPPLFRPLVLSGRGTICPQIVLDYMLSPRGDDVACSPGVDVVSVDAIRGQLQDRAGRCKQAVVHKLLWV
jgi:hypothetical protein